MVPHDLHTGRAKRIVEDLALLAQTGREMDKEIGLCDKRPPKQVSRFFQGMYIIYVALCMCADND